MIDEQTGFLADLSLNGIFEAFTGLDEAGEGGIDALCPA